MSPDVWGPARRQITGEKGEASFEVTSIAIGHFEKHSAVPADEEKAQVIEVLEALGARAVAVDIDVGTKSQRVVTDCLTDWAKRANASNSLLYWVGHGQADEDGAWLAVHETQSFMGDGTGIGPATMATHIAQHWLGRRDSDNWAVVVIEACGATRFINLLDSELSRRQSPPQRLVLLGVGGNGSSHLGSFRRALGSALRSYTDNDKHIRLGDLMLRTRGYLAYGTLKLIDLAPEPVLPRRPVLPGGVTATLDVYAELQDFLHRMPADERGHFVPKAQGAEQGELAWYFVGRVFEMQQICGWLREQTQGLLIVTGRAGAGKSALLGHVLMYANEELRELLVRHGLIERLNEQELPPTDVFDFVLHLTGLTVYDFVARLMLALGEEAPASSLSESVERLISNLQGRDTPFTLLVDALDEAHESQGIAGSVLRRIAEQPGCRVVVGTRRSTLEGPDQPETTDENLIDALGRSSNNSSVEVAQDPIAIGQYVSKRLQHAKRNGRLAQEFDSEEFASLIQVQPSTQFLYARLAVHEILAQRELATNRVWLLKLLKHDHRGLFGQAVKRMAALDPSNEVLLEALALAGGRGLPRADGIWAIVATALLDLGEFADAVITEQHIDRILETAAPYIMLDSEDGQSVYRLAHRTFQEHFLHRRSDAGWLDGADRLRARHALIATALVGFAKESSSSGGSRYIQSHLAGHVAAAGLWKELVRHPNLLDRLDPSSVALGVLRHSFGRSGEALPDEVAAIASAHHLLAPLEPGDRALTRQVAMATLRGCADWLGKAWSASAGDRPQIRWATLVQSTMHVTLTGHTKAVRSLAALTLRDGRCLLASGSDDNTVRLWDPATGTAVGPPLAGDIGSVTALAALTLPDGRCLLAAGGRGGTVRLWDPAMGISVGEPLSGPESLSSLAALALPDGRCLLAAGGYYESVRLWDPMTGTEAGSLLSSHATDVCSLAALTLPDGRRLLASGGGIEDPSVRLCDPVTDTAVGDPLIGNFKGVLSIAALMLADGRCLLASSGHDGIVRLWDAATGIPFGSTVHPGPVFALVPMMLPDGRCVLASGSNEATVQLWDPASNTAVAIPLAGHAGAVTSLAALALPDGRCLLASGSDDATVRLWDPAIGGAVGSPLVNGTAGATSSATLMLPDGRYLLAFGRHDGTVQLLDLAVGTPVGSPMVIYTDLVDSLIALPMADGRCLLACGSRSSFGRHDYTVQLWDPVTGTAVGSPLAGHTSSVTSLAAITMPKGRRLLASGSADGTVRVWDPVSGALVGSPLEPLDGRPYSVTSLTSLTLPDGRGLLAAGEYDATVRLWDLATGTEVGSLLAGKVGVVRSLTTVTLPDGRDLIASGNDDGTIRLWEPTIKRAFCPLIIGHIGPVSALTSLTLPDGRCLLVSGGHDGFIRIWDVQIGVTLHVVRQERRIWTLSTAQGMLFVGTSLGIFAIEGPWT